MERSTMLCSWVKQKIRLGHVFWCFLYVYQRVCVGSISVPPFRQVITTYHNLRWAILKHEWPWQSSSYIWTLLPCRFLVMKNKTRSQSHTGVVPQLCREMTVSMRWIKVLFFIPQRSMQWQLNQIDQIDIFSRSSRSFWKEVSGVWCRGQVPSPNMSIFFFCRCSCWCWCWCWWWWWWWCWWWWWWWLWWWWWWSCNIQRTGC